MGHMVSLLYTLFQLAVCIILNVEFSGMPRIFRAVVGDVWLTAGVMMGFGARIFFWSPYFSPGIVGWRCLLVAVATLPTRESMPASTQTSNGMHFAGQLSKPFYLASLIACFAASIILALLIFAALASDSHGDEEVAIVLAVLLFIPMVCSTVVMAVLIHKMWSSIQDGAPRTTPGKAVGVLFIPLSNYYWVFQALWGWTRDFNAYTVAKTLRAPRMPEGLARAICILAVVSIIPFVGIATSIANVILMTIFVSRVCHGVNAIAPTNRGVQPAIA